MGGLRLLSIFRDFRLLVEAIGELVSVLGELAGALLEIVATNKGLGPMIDRVEALELGRGQFEADCEGKLLKAEGKLKAANNSEARERQLKRSYESQTEALTLIGEDPETPGDPVRADHVEPGEAERVPAVRLDVAPNDKQAALRRKWGVTA